MPRQPGIDLHPAIFSAKRATFRSATTKTAGYPSRYPIISAIFCPLYILHFIKSVVSQPLKLSIISENRKANHADKRVYWHIFRTLPLKNLVIRQKSLTLPFPFWKCPNGGIGRRVGLKIQCPLKDVPVRARLWAQKKPLRNPGRPFCLEGSAPNKEKNLIQHLISQSYQ